MSKPLSQGKLKYYIEPTILIYIILKKNEGVLPHIDDSHQSYGEV